MFAPVVAAPFEETTWPKVVGIDSTNFKPGNKSTIGFSVVAAVGYEHKGDKGRVVALRAVRGGISRSDWLRFFSRLDGLPEMVITDGDQAQVNAIEALPNSTVLRTSRWHELKDWRELLTRKNTTIPHAKEVWKIVSKAPYWPAKWDNLLSDIAPFTSDWNRVQKSNFERWYRSRHKRIAADLARAAEKGIYWGWSAGRAEWALKEVKQTIGPRAFGLRNEYRTQWLLELIRSRLNRRDTFEGYLRSIADHLHDPNTVLDRQRKHNDKASIPSLHGW